MELNVLAFTVRLTYLQKLRLSSIVKVIKRTGIERAVQVARVLHSLHTSVRELRGNRQLEICKYSNGVIII